MKISTNVKFCLASRSWNESEEAYGSHSPWKLYMQDLTKGDIALFVQDKLESNKRFQALRRYDKRCPDFVQEVVTSAEGIFLWVSLVVISLLDGLTNDDRIEDLQRRLRQLPTDLDKLFDHILSTIPPFYREHAAHLLLVALSTPRTLSLLSYWLIDQGRHYDARSKLESDDQILYQLQRMPGRLNTLSKGLLQVSPKIIVGAALRWGHGKKVDLLHRTVVEYLNHPRIRTKLESWANKQFNAYVAICKGLLAQAPMMFDDVFGIDERPLRTLVGCFYRTIEAMESDDDLEDEEIYYVKTMDKVLGDMERKSKRLVKMGIYQHITGSSKGLGVEEIAITMNLVKYLQKVAGLTKFTLKYGLSLLLNERALRVPRDDDEFRWKSVQTLRILLEKGCSPNEKRENRKLSVWASYLQDLRTYKKEVLGGLNPALRLAIITVLLEFGADPKAKCLTKDKFSDKTCKAEHHLQRILTASQYADLKHLIEPSLTTRTKTKLLGLKKKGRSRSNERAKRK